MRKRFLFLAGRSGLLANRRGQMAVFLALTFQIFFVFFAMIVNIGLVSYQKINLQNAVDLAVYYAGQKQAEILNAIAHENYQIRQAYKLLVWRYRVLASSGLTVHPGSAFNMNPNEKDEPWLDVSGKTPSAYSLTPATCVVTNEWENSYNATNLCQDYRAIPVFVPHPAGPDPLGLATILSQVFKQAITQIKDSCGAAGSNNWLYAASIFYAYRLQIAQHKRVIRWLAQGLAAPKAQWLDLSGQSIELGVQNTLKKNLTAPNMQQPPEIEIYNSLEGIPWTKWLPEIPLDIVLQYVDINNSCEKAARDAGVAPAVPLGNAQLQKQLLKYAGTEPPMLGAELDPMQSTLGVEKNPWLLAYVGVKATVQARTIFSPFGRPVAMTARAFAQPFGGRVGPWYQNTWPRESPQSTGKYVDGLAPFRFKQFPRDGAVPASLGKRLYPNYSRYPDDQLGLTSRLSLTTLPPREKRLHKYSVAQLAEAIASDSPSNDALAWDKGPPPSVPLVRPYEVAAVTPDVFDITYFSVDATAKQNYFDVLAARPDRPPGLPRLDLGARPGGGTPRDLSNYQVRDQILETAALPDLAKIFYLVRDPYHLLTAWNSSALYRYEFPQKSFGACYTAPGPNVPAPGGCVAGGRTGYSVRIISKTYLLSNEHLFGGAGIGPAAILNPPPEEF